jgi:type 1 glutamine amidotransferase
LAELLFITDVAPYPAAANVQIANLSHGSIGQAVVAVEQIANSCELGFRHFARSSDVELEEIVRASVLILFTIGETPWNEQQRRLIEHRVGNGELGLVGLHSATDSAYDWQAFGDLIGARFDGHPATGDLTITVVDRQHPSTAHLRSPWRFKDELYVFRNLVQDARVLLAIELGSVPPGERAPRDWHGPRALPLAWSIERGATRTFYTALGHFAAAYEDEAFLKHLRGGIEWVQRTSQ